MSDFAKDINVPTNDCISRQAAIDAVEKESQVDGAYGYMDTKSIVDLLNDLPSAQPGRYMVTTAESTDLDILKGIINKPSDITLIPLPKAEPGWIPVKTRQMTEEERWYWEEHTGVELEAEDAVFFDCQMPDDGQEVWVCYKSGTVSEDVCERDDFCGLEGNGDWSDIVAWMPRIKPEPWKGEV